MADLITIGGEEFYLVPRAEYDKGVDEINWLYCLEAAGVDNWEGYDVAMRMLNGESEDGDF